MTPTQLISAVLLAGTALPAGLAAATPETQAIAMSDAQTQSDRTHKQELESFTRAISQQHGGELARFEDAVCIAVGGLADPYNAIFAQRMADDARQADIGLAKPGCQPNLIVFLSDRPRQDLAALAHKESFLASIGRPGQSPRQLSQGKGPVYMMTFTEMANTMGMHARVGSDVDNLAPKIQVYDSSIINPLVRQDISAVMMVIDSSATLGKNLDQIADYAAFRTLADLKDIAPATSEPTILTLFSQPTAPLGLTHYDRAYLKGLYGGQPTMKAETRMHEIVNIAMRDDVKH